MKKVILQNTNKLSNKHFKEIKVFIKTNTLKNDFLWKQLSCNVPTKSLLKPSNNDINPI